MTDDPAPGDGGLAGRRFKLAIEKGAPLLGSLGGAGVGMVGGPEGAFAGAAGGWAIGEAIRSVGLRVLARMSDHEAARVGLVALVVEQDKRERQARGEERRQDGYFDPGEDARNNAEELLEGVLRYAAETYEERKLPYLAHLYDAVSYDPSISSAMAIYLLKLAHELSYRQLVALSVCADQDREDTVFVQLIGEGLLDRPHAADPSAAGEVELLAARGLVADRQDEAHIEARLSGREPTRRYAATTAGARLARAMRLELISDRDIRSWLVAKAGRAPAS